MPAITPLDGAAVAAAFRGLGVSHVVWVPDSVLGRWEAALLAEPSLQLIRAAREGEAIAIAGGLLLGGAHPIVLLQCTGLFEAGDSLRNIVHDLGLPLFLVVGLRGVLAARRGPTHDTCPRFAVPFVQMWDIPHVVVEAEDGIEPLVRAFREARAARRPAAVLLPE